MMKLNGDRFKNLQKETLSEIALSFSNNSVISST